MMAMSILVDQIEIRDDRYYFKGRSGGVINVGGMKVHPEEIEAVLNVHAWITNVTQCTSRRNPITGAVVAAEVVLMTSDELREVVPIKRSSGNK